jgi:hypothetical protein
MLQIERTDRTVCDSIDISLLHATAAALGAVTRAAVSAKLEM